MKKVVMIAIMFSGSLYEQDSVARVKVTNLLDVPVFLEYHWTPEMPYLDETDRFLGFPKAKLRSSLKFKVLPISWPRGRSPFGGAGLGGGMPEVRDAELLNPKTRYVVLTDSGALLYDKTLDPYEYGNRKIIIRQNEQGNVVVESSADWSL